MTVHSRLDTLSLRITVVDPAGWRAKIGLEGMLLDAAKAKRSAVWEVESAGWHLA